MVYDDGKDCSVISTIRERDGAILGSRFYVCCT